MAPVYPVNITFWNLAKAFLEKSCDYSRKTFFFTWRDFFADSVLYQCGSGSCFKKNLPYEEFAVVKKNDQKKKKKKKKKKTEMGKI